MLTLVEHCVVDNFLDRPNLGCAMLIAACQEKGIKTTLVKGQTYYLKNMFVDDSEELWNLIQDLKERDLRKIGISRYKKSIQGKRIREFQDELKSLYRYVIVDKNPRNYFDARALRKFYNLYCIFRSVYIYYLKVLNYTKLKIIDRYVSLISENNPRYVGFSLQTAFDIFSRTIRKRVKEQADIPIIIGGDLTPFINLEKLNEIFKEECFDYLVVGAGEHALPSLIETLDGRKEPKGIGNVFYRKDNKIRGNDLEIINDLDSLPYPDYSQFDLDLYLTPRRILPLQTARGCSWRKCAFCSFQKINLGKCRFFSIDKIIKTLQYLSKTYLCQFFSFNQEELSPGQAKKISKAILSNNIKNINIYSTARLEGGYNNSALLKTMRKAGFVQLHWGMESGNQRILNLMNKGTNVKAMNQVLKKSHESKISNICFVLFGFPGETKEEAEQTVEFLKRNAIHIDDIAESRFALREHSPIEKNPEKWNIVVKKDGNYLTKSGMGCKTIDTFYAEFFKKFPGINTKKITSGKLNYLLSGHYRGTAHFLISGHNILSSEILLERLKNRKLSSIFPIVLGETKRKDKVIVLYPINIKETYFINQFRPEKAKTLDSLEEKIFILSCGTLSVEDIISAIDKDCKKKSRKKYLRKKCIDFFQLIFSKNWGLGFAKSW